MKSEDQNKTTPNTSSMDDGELQFTCPQCGGNKLFLRQEALLEVQAVHADGTVEFDDVYPDKDLAFECSDCNYALKDEDGLLVWSGEDLAAWLIANCDQADQ